MATRNHVTIAPAATWTEVVAPVSAETDVALQLVVGRNAQWTFHTAAPASGDEVGFAFTDGAAFSVTVPISNGLYVRVFDEASAKVAFAHA